MDPYEFKATSPDHRYTVHVRERTEDLFPAEDHQEPRFKAESLRMWKELGVDAHFKAATRVHVDGDGWKDLVGVQSPRDDNDQAWESFYAAKDSAFAVAIDGAGRFLADHGLNVSLLGSRYMRSLYAGCVMCGCSEGFVSADIVYPPQGGRPVDIWVTVN